MVERIRRRRAAKPSGSGIWPLAVFLLGVFALGAGAFLMAGGDAQPVGRVLKDLATKGEVGPVVTKREAIVSDFLEIKLRVMAERNGIGFDQKSAKYFAEMYRPQAEALADAMVDIEQRCRAQALGDEVCRRAKERVLRFFSEMPPHMKPNNGFVQLALDEAARQVSRESISERSIKDAVRSR